MKKAASLFSLIFVFASFWRINAQDSLNNPMDSALYYLIHQRYSKSDSVLDVILKNDPGNMGAEYMHLANEQTKMLDFESYDIEGDDYITRADSMVDLFKKALPSKKGVDSLKCLFFIGNTLGGKSITQAKIGKWPSAIRNGLRSLSYYKQVVKADSSFYAAYLGLGIFNYYISLHLGWLPFFGDKTQEGLRQIRLASQGCIPYSLVAKNSLGWIMIDRKEYDAADSIASSVINELPDNTIFIRLKVRTALWRKDWQTSIALARSLVDISEKRDPVNWSDLLCGYQALVSCYDNLGMKTECLEWAQKALAIKVPDPYSKIPYVKKHQKSIVEIQEKYTKH
jgi:tetratricopeptide (TPR) repeat protein